MNIDEYVDDLFAGYRSTAELDDFKAEVLANLRDRIADLEASGASHSEALVKATEELGDISQIASEMSEKRVRDVFDTMYLHNKVRPGKGHVFGYVLAGMVLLAGLTLGVLSWVVPWDTAMRVIIAIGLVCLPIAAFTSLGVTQETTTNMPVPTWRGLGYGLGVFLTLTGIALGATFAFANWGQIPWGIVLGWGVPPIIVGVGILAFCGLTQTNRKKPWVRAHNDRMAEEMSARANDPQTVAGWVRFAMFTAVTWILAIAVFFVLGFTVGFAYAWIVFIVAIAITVLLLAVALTNMFTVHTN